MQITAFLAAWLLAARRPFGVGKVVTATAAVLAVALSRIHLQVHFPSDVAFGMVAAVLWVIACERATRRNFRD
jgi:undecaprenyl-diphosphatase